MIEFWSNASPALIMLMIGVNGWMVRDWVSFKAEMRTRMAVMETKIDHMEHRNEGGR